MPAPTTIAFPARRPNQAVLSPHERNLLHTCFIPLMIWNRHVNFYAMTWNEDYWLFTSRFCADMTVMKEENSPRIIITSLLIGNKQRRYFKILSWFSKIMAVPMPIPIHVCVETTKRFCIANWFFLARLGPASERRVDSSKQSGKCSENGQRCNQNKLCPCHWTTIRPVFNSFDSQSFVKWTAFDINTLMLIPQSNAREVYNQIRDLARLEKTAVLILVAGECDSIAASHIFSVTRHFFSRW